MDIIEDRGYWNSAKQCEVAAHVEALQATVQKQSAEVKYQQQCRYMAIEALNEARLDFNEELLAEQHKVKVLTDALESWKGIAENCSIEAGYCCCGEDMKTHSHPMSCGHSPVDMADGPVSNAMELTYKALAAVKGE